MADYPITISRQRVAIESNPERLNGFTNKYTVKYSDIALSSATGSTDTVSVTLGTTPALWACTRAVANVTTAFAGTGGLALTVGTSGSTAAILASASVLTAGLKQNTNGANSVATPTSATSTASASLVATFTNSVGSSPSVLTAGELDIYLNVLDLAKIG